MITGGVVIFSHITVGSSDLERSSQFYGVVLLPLGLKKRQVYPDGGPPSACWVVAEDQLPRFYVYQPFNRQPASAGNGAMIAFSAPSIAAVDTAYAAAMAFGGVDEGEPGARPHYGEGYYGAYMRDPDGNKVHVVYRGDLL